ncbi:hypothetical protein PaeCFBP13512_19350 [Paenibacillus sp. CFBP13512]|uniref:glycosyltransferase family 2 protein n=1 Tax=Paenibacillus sp. CFBP13512 TaxID=2184007 RepID=UPI0010C03046|nr:glycosyltransferase [Paenibacillus sp. CFBP13512]TKJ86652.1 hypothetical protein PaeCFBP13512_19350 [Paenibacillus sp. CFBP13512]
MELIDALIKAKIITEKQVDDIGILAINNNSNRSYQSATSRFLIMYNQVSLCTVKKLPNNQLYNLQYILIMQKTLQTADLLRAPQILEVVEYKDYIYIIEEFIEGTSLDQLYANHVIQKKELVTILHNVFTEALNVKAGEFYLNQKEEIKGLIAEIDYLSWTVEAKQTFSNYLAEHFELVADSPSLVSGDLWLKNILISFDMKPYLVDYDLSHVTQFKWIEIIRVVHYAYHSGLDLELKDFASLLPKHAEQDVLYMIFFLYEINLQSRILDKGSFEIVKKNLQLELKEVFQKKFPNFFVEENKDAILEEEYQNFVQIYWQSLNDKTFSEENSLKSELVFDVFKVYKFEIPAKKIINLRIDPINSSGMVEIKNFIMQNTKKEILYTWSNKDVSVIGTGQGIWDKNLLRIFSFEEDPQLLMSIPSFSNENEMLFIKIEMKITKDTSYILNQLNQMNIIENELNDLKDQFSSAENELNITKSELNITRNELNSFQKVLTEKESSFEIIKTELAMIKNSRSWKTTEGLRKIGRKLKKIKYAYKRGLKKLAGQRSIDLQPIHEIIPTNYGWQSIGKDPQFLLNLPVHKKILEVSYISSAEYDVPLELYYDLGNGMTEKQIIIIGTISKGTEVFKRSRIRIPSGIHSFRLDPGNKEQMFTLHNIMYRPITQLELVLKPVYKFFRNHGLRPSTIKIFISKSIKILKKDGLKGIQAKGEYVHLGVSESNYQEFLKITEKTAEDWQQMKDQLQTLIYKPLISILVPVYNVEEKWLRACIDSVRQQVYSNWELCLVDDCSTKPHIRPILEEYIALDNRIKIKFREVNGHISNTSNDAIQMATGEFIALLDHDDELSKDALIENILLLNRLPEADIIYSDEDKISIEGERHSPFFKPDWSPDSLLSQMYTSHLTLYRKSLVQDVGGFRVGFEGSQDYDLMLRASEKTNAIYHIPKVLYHWRAIPESTAMINSSKNYTHMAGIKALEETIIRRNFNAYVEGAGDIPNLYRVHHKPTGNPKVSIIIPSKNMTQVLDTCLNSIIEKTTYTNYEIIIIDNGSDDVTTQQLYDRWSIREPERFKVFQYDIPFNYSKLNNFGCTKAEGELLLFLNNDIEVITPEWLEEMVGQAIRSRVGAVGAKLLYPDYTIQHAGVILGIGGVAGHSHKNFQSSEYGYFSRLKMVSNYSAVTAACLMVRKEICEEVEGFAEDLQVAFNDVDFCLKVREKGYWNVWLPQVQLIHYESKSRGYEDTPEKQKRFNSEIIRMQEKWPDELREDPFYNPNLSKEREDFSLGSAYK